jgi:hypothetical protein
MKTQTGKGKRGHGLGWAALAAMSAGAVLQIPSCEGVLTTVNPCGTVFAFCNGRDIDALFADIPAFELDPSCTIPFFGVDNPEAAGGCATVEIFPTTPGPRP